MCVPKEVSPPLRPMFPTCAWQMSKLKPVSRRLALSVALQHTPQWWLDAWQRVFLLPWELRVCSCFLTMGSWIIIRNSLSSISKCPEMAWWAILCLRGCGSYWQEYAFRGTDPCSCKGKGTGFILGPVLRALSALTHFTLQNPVRWILAITPFYRQ